MGPYLLFGLVCLQRYCNISMIHDFDVSKRRQQEKRDVCPSLMKFVALGMLSLVVNCE